MPPPVTLLSPSYKHPCDDTGLAGIIQGNPLVSRAVTSSHLQSPSACKVKIFTSFRAWDMDIFGAINLTTTGSHSRVLSQGMIGSDLHVLELIVAILDNRL